ncbi:hypothetical protein V6N13_146256 [Hibiscus sabdariffa]|uniref:Secreted protein n=1 Tax=Hibiscus sabdariffa TaxID=183260 RepID=A0ABR2TS32_9ROSI
MTKALIIVLSFILILSVHFTVGQGIQIKGFVKLSTHGNFANQITSSSDGELSLDQAAKISEEIERTFEKKEKAIDTSPEVESATEKDEREVAASIIADLTREEQADQMDIAMSPEYE